MKKSRAIFILTLLLMSITSLMAQTTFEVLSPFTEVVLKGSLNVELIPSDQTKAVVTVHGAGANAVERNVKNGRLSIILRVGVMDRDKDIKADVKIYYNTLTYIGVESAKVGAGLPVKGEYLKVETLGGNNNFNLNVDVGVLEIIAIGESKISFGGQAGRIDVKSNMGARVDCAACRSDLITATARKADIVVRTDGELHATAAASGNIFYLGNPKLFATAKLGSGVIAVKTRSEQVSY